MSYPQGGYPQQPYSGGGNPAESGGGTNPATAVIAALLALAVAAFEIVVLVKTFDAIGVRGGISSLLPAEQYVILGLQAVAGLLLLLGAMFTFGRKMAGAVLIILGAIVAIAGFFVEPLVLGAGSALGTWLELMFQFSGAETTFRALTLIVAPLVLILAVLPPTLNHLRRGWSDDNRYAAGPSSGGFPQQQEPGGYPQPQQGWHPGGYPQQGQQGGYPPQQQGW